MRLKHSFLIGPSELAFITQHGPLKEKNDFMTGSLVKVESDLNELLQIIKSRPIIQPHVASQPVSTIEIHEMQTTSLISTLRRSVSPMPLPTVEKQTQFEAAETEPQFEKTDRDTQTVDDKIISIETQTELVKSSSAATETIEVQVRPRTPSRVCLNPAFVESLKDVTVKEGENVLLECRLDVFFFKVRQGQIMVKECLGFRFLQDIWIGETDCLAEGRD